VKNKGEGAKSKVRAIFNFELKAKDQGDIKNMRKVGMGRETYSEFLQK
jgi:hypothetical protein